MEAPLDNGSKTRRSWYIFTQHHPCSRNNVMKMTTVAKNEGNNQRHSKWRKKKSPNHEDIRKSHLSNRASQSEVYRARLTSSLEYHDQPEQFLSQRRMPSRRLETD